MDQSSVHFETKNCTSIIDNITKSIEEFINSQTDVDYYEIEYNNNKIFLWYWDEENILDDDIDYIKIIITEIMEDKSETLYFKLIGYRALQGKCKKVDAIYCVDNEIVKCLCTRRYK